MKLLLLVFAALVANISAKAHLEPDFIAKYNDQRYYNDLLIGLIEELKEFLVEEGYDPLYIEDESISYALPVAVIFNVHAQVQEVHVNGLSNIEVNNIDFSILSRRLDFDLYLPMIDLAFKRVAGDVMVFGNEFKGAGSGRLVLKGIRIAGHTVVGILGGISLNSLNLECGIDSIESNVNVNLLGNDVTEDFNHFLEVTVIDKLRELKEPVNELIAHYALEIINEYILPNIDLPIK